MIFDNSVGYPQKAEIGKILSKPIILTDKQWKKLRQRLRQDYAPSVTLIRDRMRKTLGFVDREHCWYTEQHGFMSMIYLDFYNEPKRTMFILKYSEYLDKSQCDIS